MEIGMTSEEKRIFTARIAQANRSELVVILFELFEYSICEAEKGFAENQPEHAVKYMRKAQECVAELRGSLDFKYELSKNLVSLYRYVNEQLVMGITKREMIHFDSIKDIMAGLQESFQKISKTDHSGAVMQNSQQVYAGLTYGRGSLNEITLDATASRSFQV